MTFNSLDRQGRKSLEESDFRMLDKWSPSPYFMVEANTLAKEEVGIGPGAVVPAGLGSWEEWEGGF